GWKAVGNKLSDQMLSGVKELDSDPRSKEQEATRQASLFGEEAPQPEKKAPAPKKAAPEPAEKKTYKTGDTIEFD
ncbi:MAG: hypothetical protein KDC61_08410, partial [Saprospiraceae bacterium]|nr:hypothetical protein [Saprospiraceae bacterium]